MKSVMPDIGETIARLVARRDLPTLRHLLTSCEDRAEDAALIPWPALAASWAISAGRVESAIRQLERRT